MAHKHTHTLVNTFKGILYKTHPSGNLEINLTYYANYAHKKMKQLENLIPERKMNFSINVQ